MGDSQVAVQPAQTRRQVLAIGLGLGGGAVVFVLALVVTVVVVSMRGTAPDEGVVPTPTVTLVLFALAAACVAAGFWRVMRIGRAGAIARGEDPDAPPALSWRTVISPRGVARLLFAARRTHGGADELVARLGAVRAWVGLAVVCSVIAWYDVSALSGLVEGTLNSGFNLLVASSAALLLVIGILYPFVPAVDRRRATRALARPVLVLILLWVIAGAISRLGVWLDTENLGPEDGDPFSALLVPVVVLAALVWVLVFAILAAKYCGENGFRSGEAHPSLPPLITLVVIWGFLALSTVVPGRLPFLVDDGETPVPGDVERLLSWCGVLTLSALCLLEIYRLARRGHRLPTGPWA